jgi:hypothetical protein
MSLPLFDFSFKDARYCERSCLQQTIMAIADQRKYHVTLIPAPTTMLSDTQRLF